LEKDKAMDKPRQVSRVPLKQIRPSRNNPRLIKRQDMIDARAASMGQSGQSTPIKIRPLTPDEKGQETNHEIQYEIIDGELRYWAALKNEDKEIDAFILDMTPEEAFEEAVRSNRINMLGWFEDFIAMERMVKAGKHQKQQIAAIFEVDGSKITRALKILGVLNQAGRDLVFENFKKSDAKRQISEHALLRLADLGDKKEVEKALPVVLGRQMTEAQVKRLVGWVKGGQKPEDYNPQKAAGLDQQTTKGTKLDKAEGQVQQPPQSPSQAPVGTPTNPHPRFKAVGHALGSAFHWAGQNSLHLLKALAGYGKQVAVKSVNKSIKHYFKRLVGTVVKTAVLLILLAAGVFFFIPGPASRKIAWFMNLQHLGTSSASAMIPQVGVAGSPSEPAQPNLVQASSVPITGTGGIGAPSTAQSASGVGNEAPNQTTSQNLTTANSVTPKKPSTRDEKNAQAALVFARHYFGANYQNIASWKDFFKQAIDDEDYDPFMDNHFPYDKIHEIWTRMIPPIRFW
jgi:ParB-like chromosome segregation protein Spo0J